MNLNGVNRFLIALLAAYTILLVAIGVNYAVLWRAGELQSLDKIVRDQRDRGEIYNALSIGFADYKYAAYRQRAPEIVAIGTSRAMQIRQQYFLKPFYNLGGLVQGAGQANVLADRLLLRGIPPRIVIFALDYWTFCRLATDRAPDKAVRDVFHDGMGQPQRHFLIYHLLFDGRFSVADYVRLFSSQNSTEADRIGLGAKIGKSGFAADGSIYSFPPNAGALDRRWESAVALISSGGAQMIKDCQVSNVAIESLKHFVGRLDNAGVKTILFMAPLPGAVIKRMQDDGRYGYIGELRKSLAARYPRRFYDFFDMRDVASDSEFYDGLHGGDVVYRRIVLTIARSAGSALGGLVDEKSMQSQIDLWSGRAQVPTDPIVQKFFVQESR
jgi:hypothetical protein